MILTHILEVIIFGALLLMGFLLISNPFNVNHKANRYLGVFTFLWSMFWFEEVIVAVGGTFLIADTPLFKFLSFISPLPLYLSIRFFTNPNYKFKKQSLFYTPVLVLFVLLSLVPNEGNASIRVLTIVLLFAHSLFILISSYLLIRRHQRKIKQFASNTIDIDLNWLELIIISFLLIFLFILVFNILFYEAPLNLFMNLIMLVFVFYYSYSALKQKEIFPLDEYERRELLKEKEDDNNDLSKRKIISDERLLELKDKLNQLMLDEEPYLEPDLTLSKLAKQLSISTNQLSYVINQGFEDNFHGYINMFRVKKAKHLLLDKKSDHLSIIGVAFESGFSSKTAFNTTFKKITDTTPSEFKKKSSGI